VYVWLVFDGRGGFVAKGTAPRSLGDRSMSTAMGSRLIPGYDPLLGRHVREYGILGYGAVAPNSPPVMWVRLGDASGQQPGRPLEVLPDSMVDKRVLYRPPLRYPALLRHAGIEGRVIVQALIDTTGRAEPGSVRIIQSSHPGFEESAKSYMRQALFRPARLRGRPVRVVMDLPLEFRLNK
jgi:TonB family protein